MNSDELIAIYASPESVPRNPGLDALDHVDWFLVHEAYGTGEKIPALIRALVSPEPIHRNYAIEDLLTRIWHQGTVYSATAKVVPILYDVLESDTTPGKSAIAFLLATLADGAPPFASCEDDLEEYAKWQEILAKSNRSLALELEEGKRFGAEIRRQLAARMDLLYPYIRDPVPEIRCSVVLAIGLFPEIARRVASDLRNAHNEETDTYVKAALRDVLDALA